MLKEIIWKQIYWQTLHTEKNIDGTFKISRQIIKYIYTSIEVKTYKIKHYLFITQLEDKEIMFGYLYLYKHNL